MIYSPELATKQLRKFCIRYALWHPQSIQVRDAFIGVKDPDQWQAVMNEHYSVNMPGVWPQFDDTSVSEN